MLLVRLPYDNEERIVHDVGRHKASHRGWHRYSILFYFDAAVVKISAGVTVAVSSLTAQTAALTSAWISACA